MIRPFIVTACAAATLVAGQTTAFSAPKGTDMVRQCEAVAAPGTTTSHACPERLRARKAKTPPSTPPPVPVPKVVEDQVWIKSVLYPSPEGGGGAGGGGGGGRGR